MTNLNDLLFFVRAVDCGGFAAAARLLDVPKSSVSKRVAELEKQLDARLVHRSSRSFVLTDVGREVYDHARAAMTEVEAAESAVKRRRSEPSGVVRITSSVPVAQFELASKLPRFMRQHPKVTVHVQVTDRFVDLLQENVDIAVRSHFAPLRDSELVQRQIRSEPIVLAASPAYLAQHSVPDTSDSLAAHHGLLAPNAGTGASWALRNGSGDEAQVAPVARFLSNESVTLMEAAQTDLGIVALPRGMLTKHFDAGRLVHVLPGWTAGTVITTVLTPHRRGQLPSVRAVIDFLAAEAVSA
ncbi:MAG TPA: LysR substrate-binding domain-containing protein [Rhizobacter sp.]